MARLSKFTLAVLILALPTLGWAQGKIAVVDLQEAILQTDLAQKRLAEIREQSDYKSDKAEYDRLKKEFDELTKEHQNLKKELRRRDEQACDAFKAVR